MPNNISSVVQSTQAIPLQTAQTLPSSPKHSKKFIFILLIIILLILISGGYFIYQKRNLKNISIEQAPTKQKDQTIIDILSLPNWIKYTNVTKLADGSLQVLTMEGTEIHVPNIYDFVDIGIKGFEIQVKMITVSKKDGSPKSSFIVLLVWFVPLILRISIALSRRPRFL